MITRSFHAMGTSVRLLVDDGGRVALVDEGEREFHRLEAIFSRFRPESELSRLNQERSLAVGPELLAVVQLALDARARTAGRFDPTVHDAVAAAGYDRSFELVASGSGRREPTAVRPRCGGRVSVEGAVVSLDDGVRLDLGGIAKGWAADHVLAMLSSAAPALVDAGGDVVVRGRPWPVGVEAPGGILTLELLDGALATSGRDRRRWRVAGSDAHHLIDPSTGQPADTDILTVTALGGTAAEAEVRATTLFLAGNAEAAVEEADAEGVPAVVVTDDGRMLLAGGLP